MSSETITRNDLEAILNKIYPSPASTITSADITKWNRIENIGSFISIGGDADATMNLSTSNKRPSLPVTKSKAGSAFSNNQDVGTTQGIYCNISGIIIVSGFMRFTTGFTANDNVYMTLFKNGDSYGPSFRWRPTVSAPQESRTLPALPMPVNAGDVISIQTYNSTGARGTVNTELTGLNATYISKLFV